MSETENYKENRDHCKRISDELQEICEGHIFKCPECGATFNFEDDEEHMFCSDISRMISMMLNTDVIAKRNIAA